MKYLAFYRANRELFLGSIDAGNVAVLRSYPSIAYHNARAQLSAILVEQALIQSRIPFDLIFDEHVADLSKYRVLVLPDSECLSNQQIALIRRFVEGGGGLVATGLAGLYDEWRRLRVESGLRGLVDWQTPARPYEEDVAAVVEAGTPARKDVGKGRVVYLPNVPFDGPLPPAENYFTISNRYWKRPKNWREIAEAVRWTSRDELPMEIRGPEYLVANLVSQPLKRRTMVHLINYNAGAGAIREVNVTCRMRGVTPAKEVQLYSPDFEAPVSVAGTYAGSRISFTVPEVKVYVIALVNW